MTAYFLGIDGGGTRCRAALSDESGRVIGRAVAGPANILTDPEGTLKNIIEAAAAAFENAGVAKNFQDVSVVLGLAGTNVGTAVSYLQQNLPFSLFEIVHDGVIALEGAIGPDDGAIGILGTGSAFVVRKDGAIQSIGGWGFKAGDFGSGARLGQALVQEALLAADGIKPRTALLNALLERYSNRQEDLANFAAEARPGDFGSLVGLLVEYEKQGDSSARQIFKDAAAIVDLTLDEVQRRLGGAGKISLLGGVAPILKPYLADRHQDYLAEPLNEPVIGALNLARNLPRRQMEAAS